MITAAPDRWRNGAVGSRLLLGIATLLFLAAVVVAWLRWERHETAEMRIERLASAGQAHFAAFEFRELMPTADEIGDFLRSRAEEGVGWTLATDAQRAQLSAAVGSYLDAARPGQTAQRYVAWRRSIGATLIDSELFQEIVQFYGTETGTTPPGPDASLEKQFAYIWDSIRRLPENVPHALPASPQSTYISFYEMRGRTVALAHRLDDEHTQIWHGGMSRGTVALSETRPTLTEQLQRGDVVLGGALTTAVRYDDGVPRATRWEFYWNQEKRQWVLYSMAISNAVGQNIRIPPL
ncbi:MAG: hypothetical protein ACR2GY_00410 [Phycisphaerales bacterium]